MVMKTAYNYHNAVANCAVDEGAFTANERDIEGGQFANPIIAGMPVKMVAGKTLTVAPCGDGDEPVGFAEGQPIGLPERYGRAVAVRFMGDYIKEIEVNTASAQITVGVGIAFMETGGKFGLGTWELDASYAGSVTNATSDHSTGSHTHVATVVAPNKTFALGLTEASGSIPLGKTIPVLFGKYGL